MSAVGETILTTATMLAAVAVAGTLIVLMTDYARVVESRTTDLATERSLAFAIVADPGQPALAVPCGSNACLTTYVRNTGDVQVPLDGLLVLIDGAPVASQLLTNLHHGATDVFPAGELLRVEATFFGVLAAGTHTLSVLAEGQATHQEFRVP